MGGRKNKSTEKCRDVTEGREGPSETEESRSPEAGWSLAGSCARERGQEGRGLEPT